ncbi:translation elongation factor Ts [gamma proteobacterium HTCC5015]|nr:translation elongation factor Ts [gamma proteobacterium HTCC5015]
MAITAALVKELRDKTGAGMMECKKALTETDGNVEKAIEWMRKNGMAKAEKKAGRTAAEGLITMLVDGNKAALVEINCETDFVAKNDDFPAFGDSVAKRVLADAPADVEALKALPLEDGGKPIEEVRQELVARIGENIQVRRFEVIEGESAVGVYSHGGRIGVAVALKGGDEALAKDIAMHIAASRPLAIDENDVPQDVLQKEKEILVDQARQSGKPEEIIEKMIEGRLRKYLAEITLVGQPFVKDPDQTIGKLLKAAGAEVTNFVRLEVGEGIEKEESNFAEEVMAQAKGA